MKTKKNNTSAIRNSIQTKKVISSILWSQCNSNKDQNQGKEKEEDITALSDFSIEYNR